jgi:hypothetical protein
MLELRGAINIWGILPFTHKPFKYLSPRKVYLKARHYARIKRQSMHFEFDDFDIIKSGKVAYGNMRSFKDFSLKMDMEKYFKKAMNRINEIPMS